MAVRARAPARKAADPRSDPRFKRVIDRLDAGSRKLKQHPPAAKKAAEPAKAAKPPANEKAGGARANQVIKLESAETKKPQPSGFLAMLKAEIAKAMPKTLGDTEKFMKGGASESLKGSLKGNVSEQKQEATGGLKSASDQAPSEAGVPSKPVTPIAPEPGVPAPQVDGSAAMPAPKPAEEVSLQGSKTEVADATKANKIDGLNKAAWQTDARYSTVLTAKDAVAKQADAGPAKYRAQEVGTLAQAAGKALAVAKKGAAALLGVKGGSKTKVLSRQEQQKAKEELELKGFTDFVVKTFEAAKQAVDSRLTALDTSVNALFDKGTESALAAMKTYVEDALFNYKLRRYLSIPGVGLALWIKDQILELPAEVNRFYATGRALFEGRMNALAVQVANLVESQLAAAKAEVKRAQAAIAAKAATLSPGVKTRAAQVQAEYAGRFAELESGIEDKKQQLAEGLAQKYKEAFDKADESLKAIQDANKGLVAQAKEKIGELVKAMQEFKARLMGILRKGGDTIDLILKDPIAFLGNLLSAIKAGFNQFAGNILTHLKKGFIKWLFGALAGAGIEIPSDLSLPSILKLVMGVLGITYERMRAKAVKLIGERAVKAIEKVVEYVSALVKGGPAALWAKIKEDLSNLKEMVIDAIQDWIVTTIVKRAVAKVVSMFNPAGAIIQAIMMIASVVSFVVERAAQIMEFVESVINSIHAIATGAIGGAAGLIERALCNMVPILIGFLAALIGLGGIGAKIKEFIKKVQAKVDGAIDKAIAKIVAVVKKLFGKLTGKDAKADDRTEQQKLADLTSAVNAGNKILSSKGMTPTKAKKEMAGLQKKFRLTSIDVAKDDAKKYHVNAVINPSLGGPPIPLAPTFQLAPGGYRSHEGNTIPLPSGKLKEVHLVAKHGPAVDDPSLKKRLDDIRLQFIKMKSDRIAIQQGLIIGARARIAEMHKLSIGVGKTPTPKQQENIDRANKNIADATALITKYSAISQHSKADVFKALNDWKAVPMPTDKVTKFVSDVAMDTSINDALAANQKKIDAAFIDSAGNSKAVGTALVIKHTMSTSVGTGWEFDATMNLVQIGYPLTGVELHLLISSPFEFKVETGYATA